MLSEQAEFQSKSYQALLCAIVATADLIANMLSLGLITSVDSDPFSARSVQILKLPEDAILYVMEKLPQKVQQALDQFRITTMISAFQAEPQTST